MKSDRRYFNIPDAPEMIDLAVLGGGGGGNSLSLKRGYLFIIFQHPN